MKKESVSEKGSGKTPPSMVDRSDRFRVVQIQTVGLKANTMFRFSLIVCAALIFGVTAKPYKPLNKLENEAYQVAIMSIDDKGKMSWGMQVEPPEDMDKTDYNMDHPVFSEPEQDLDDVYRKEREELMVYLAPMMGKRKAGAEVRVGYSEPERDEDELYHKDEQLLPVQMETLKHQVRGASDVRMHLQPEEDFDDLYHLDVFQPVPYQRVAEAAAPADVPFQRKHSEPEEDLDDLYHQ